nr:MAG TPA: hypothetical protein [Caudoviricetes sp.]
MERIKKITKYRYLAVKLEVAFTMPVCRKEKENDSIS